jgi:hypothetical protein
MVCEEPTVGGLLLGREWGYGAGEGEAARAECGRAGTGGGRCTFLRLLGGGGDRTAT